MEQVDGHIASVVRNQSEQDVELSHKNPRPDSNDLLPQKTPSPKGSTIIPNSLTQLGSKSSNTQALWGAFHTETTIPVHVNPTKSSRRGPVSQGVLIFNEFSCNKTPSLLHFVCACLL